MVGRIGNPADAAASIDGISVDDSGNVGVGVDQPQARLHVWDGVGGFLFGSRSAIGATAQVIIADGLGDVSKILRVEAFISNGTVAGYNAFTLTLGGTTVQSVNSGSDTYQFRLNSDGSVDVRRTAGSNAGTVVVRAMWL